MTQDAYRVIWIWGLISVLSSCAIFRNSPEENHIAICNQLKHQMIWNSANGSQRLWNGATGDQMLPTEQRAETETLQKNYREEGC
jgi:hypothetical protein